MLITKIYIFPVSNPFSKLCEALNVVWECPGFGCPDSQSRQFGVKKYPDQEIWTNFWKWRVGRVPSRQNWLRGIQTKTPFSGSGLFCYCWGSCCSLVPNCILSLVWYLIMHYQILSHIIISYHMLSYLIKCYPTYCPCYVITLSQYGDTYLIYSSFYQKRTVKHSHPINYPI